MAKAKKKASKSAVATKRPRKPAPAGLIEKIQEIDARARSYRDALEKNAAEHRRAIDHALAREIWGPALRRDTPVPPAKTTIGAMVLEAMANYPRAPREGATRYARRLQKSDPRLASEELATIRRRFYD
jgi:hypothetical protein